MSLPSPDRPRASTAVPTSTPAQDDGRTPRRALQATAVVLGAALVLGGCASPEPKVQSGLEATSEAPTDEPVDRPDEDIPADLAEFYEQEVDWTGCGSFECADILVPLDWDDPTRGSITIGAKRHLAEGTSMGTILLNPGGPGGSGIEFVEYVPYMWGDPLLESYDVLGFDPRGVGESSAVACLTPEEKDVYYAKTYPLDDAGLAEMAADAAEFGAQCLEETGEVLGEVDTQSAARDMDVIRYVVGDEKLNYLGYSYGTQLGATYAGLYPEKVGRMVLDGAIDLRLTTHEQSLQQAVGFENALRAYVEDCQGGTGCPLTGSVDEGMAQVKALLDSTFANPLPTDDPDGRVLTQTLAFYGIAYPLYSESSWPNLTAALASAIEVGDGSLLLDSADGYNGRADDGTYLDNQGEAFRAINCLDDRGSSDRATMDAEYAEIVAAAPTMGEFFGYGGLGCTDWPFPVAEKEYDLAATGADPIVVIGTTNDPATPYVWAQGLAEQLESGVLVTYEGEGHTAYGVSNDCILDAVDEYFVDGTVPADGLTC